ncbi:chromosome segregation protein [Mycoplasmopsis mustelae]|uniref:Chromosome partition protein Smc n=1 Tax=Mycoplasmopsis mustelae TaxID=171289 RepID=A0A4R7UCZ8_9BACT|nr:AAA family ATPase [Mycoplasmopsis mustelae]TDV24327.1 chromosome segregation protein [Mycoplasmopsis mustelae]
MKLIKIEALGFKSFADPIVLRFDGGVAGIVGPNGSGKSNINDAIRWVLGEQSSKELRGDSMEDVIFAGSKTVQPMQRAQVTLTFDNKERLSSVDSDIITISRVLERGKGINEYYLNNEKCRHKDIKAIAMETGIGKSSLAIISQGTVSDIAHSSDEDRRLIFEEAAGVSKYKFRKAESLKKLERAEDVLGRVDVTIKELEKQLVPLRKNAEKAMKYKSMVDELKKVEIGYLAHEIQKHTEIFKTLTEELSGVQETEESYNNQIEDIDQKILNKREEILKINKILSDASGKKEGIQARIQTLERAINSERARRELIASGQGNVSEEERIKAVLGELRTLENKYRYLTDSFKEMEEKRNLSAAKISEFENAINNGNIKIKDYQNKLGQLVAKLELLEEKKNKHTNLYKGTKTVLENKVLFKGFVGMVADLIKVPHEYQTAIETILKNAAQYIVVDHSDTAVKLINFLKKNNGGRATFIPLASIKPKFIRDDYLLVTRNHPGFLGIAEDLVEIDEKYKVLNGFLLGNVVVVEDVNTANEIATIMERKYMIVTKDGDVIRVGGVMVGGTVETSEDVIGLDDKIVELKNLLPGLKGVIKETEKNIQRIQERLANEKTFYNNYNAQSLQLGFDVKSTFNQIEKYKTEAQVAQSKNITVDVNNLSISEETISGLEKDLSILNFDISSNVQIKESLDSSLTILEEERKKVSKLLQTLSASFKEKTIKCERSRVMLEKHKERLSGHYTLTLEFAKENYPLTMAPAAAEALVKELRAEIAELGNVNLESIEQLQEVEERYEFNVKNRDEVLEAKRICEEAIEEMDKKIVARLTNIVDDVNQEMHKVFSSMFGGGTAEVKFVDPKNILESGISIYAQPPGKSVKNLKLFSGGEKSLIAISLLFAILKARPLPLCILDEVEAALDEANVVRYAEYLQELKQQTQFLVITHRPGTMSRVDALFGATMQKRGVTSFFSVKLEEARKLAEKLETN